MMVASRFARGCSIAATRRGHTPRLLVLSARAPKNSRCGLASSRLWRSSGRQRNRSAVYRSQTSICGENPGDSWIEAGGLGEGAAGRLGGGLRGVVGGLAVVRVGGAGGLWGGPAPAGRSVSPGRV